MAKEAEGWLRRKLYADGETWLYCFYTRRANDNKNVEHSKVVGLVEDFPTEQDAWKEAERLGFKKLIDNQVPINPTFGELADHWRRNALIKTAGIGGRAAETIAIHISNLDGYVLPRWGRVKALDITPPDVETWFDALNTEPQTKTLPEDKEPPKGRKPKPLAWGTIQKLKSLMSLIFAHALRHKLLPLALESNPFRDAVESGGVRCCCTSDYEATVILPEQMIKLLDVLDEPETQMEWMMALVHAATALRGEEGFGLKWSDIEWGKGQIRIRRAWSKGKQTKGKNDYSLSVVAMHPVMAAFLTQWREISLYPDDGDWVFPSLKLKGRKPRAASSAAQDYLRPAAVKAGIIEEGSSKRFGWHNLRHSLATFLAGEVDVAVTMKTLRHKRLPTTMEYYNHRVNSKQQAAQGLFLDAIKMVKPDSGAIQ
jgi:integrase